MKVPNQTCDCNSSAAVAHHRLALCRKLEQAQWTRCLHPLLSLTLQMWATSVLVPTPLFLQVLRLTVTLKLAWCRDLSRCAVSSYSMLSHNMTARVSSENVVLKSPLRFVKYPNTRSNVYDSFVGVIKNADVFFKCMLELFQAPKHFYKNMFSIIFKVPKLWWCNFLNVFTFGNKRLVKKIVDLSCIFSLSVPVACIVC